MRRPFVSKLGGFRRKHAPPSGLCGHHKLLEEENLQIINAACNYYDDVIT